jgi:homoserine/homoserine lactone efflux protein
MDLSTWVAFAVLETILCITPGPAVLFTVGSTLSRGRAAGFAAVTGIVTGNTIYFVLSATSLGAILLASYEVFTLIRWAGAAYLIYLGLRALFGKHDALPESADVRGPSTEFIPSRVEGRGMTAVRPAFAGGTMTQLSNPKALIFFSALLPQFIDPHRWLVGQVAILGITSQIIEALVMTTYILLASGVARSAKKTVVAGIFERVAGVFLIGAALKLALTKRT